jgi:hypothetical protein
VAGATARRRDFRPGATVNCSVRFTLFAHLARTLTAVLVATAAITVTGSAPAQALGTRPSSAPAFNGGVYAIAQRGSTVYVGGSFTGVVAAGRSYPRERLAAFDARTGTLLNWAPAADRTVRALAVSGTSVFAGGDFGRVSGLNRDNLVQIDAVTGRLTTFAHRVSGAPYALTVGNGRLYAAGSFTAIDGYTRGNLAAFSLAGGGLDGGWRPSADDAVHTITTYGSKVYLGGTFHKVDDVSRTLRIAAVSGTGGAVDAGFRPTSAAQVNAIVADGTGVYAATGGQGGRAIAFTSHGAIRWQRVFDGDAVAITRLNGVTYVGGHFDRACLTLTNGAHGDCSGGSVPRVKLAAISGTGGLTAWAPQANGVIGVRALAAEKSAGTLAAGGDFTTVGGQSRKRFATFR